MQITEHFSKEEMEHSSTGIRLGLDNSCPPELFKNMVDVAEHLEIIRSHFNAPIHVTSCYRSPAVNEAVGGSKTSAHRFAHAADFEVQGVSNIDVCRWVSDNITDYDQIIYEFGPSGWCHMGFTTGKPRRERLTATKVKGKTVYTAGLNE
jgi:hypothetical protein